MANRKNKKTRELRRQLEALKAQIKIENRDNEPKRSQISSTNISPIKNSPVNPNTAISNQPIEHKDPHKSASILQLANDVYLKKDIFKTLILSSIAFSIILVLWIQSN